MKKKIKSFAQVISVMAITFPALALAQYVTPSGTNLASGAIFDIVKGIMDWLLAIVGIIGVIGFAIAGILYLTSAGDEERIEKAKQAMLYSIIGVIVALMGVVILTAVEAMLRGDGTVF